jgi:hypothetical protein
MNPKIQELVNQSKRLPYEHNVSLENFAELIVAECIQELLISQRCDPYTGDLFNCEYNTCINEQIQVLKTHFEIKL